MQPRCCGLGAALQRVPLPAGETGCIRVCTQTDDAGSLCGVAQQVLLRGALLHSALEKLGARTRQALTKVCC